jgi:hypothetical protein
VCPGKSKNRRQKLHFHYTFVLILRAVRATRNSELGTFTTFHVAELGPCPSNERLIDCPVAVE